MVDSMLGGAIGKARSNSDLHHAITLRNGNQLPQPASLGRGDKQQAGWVLRSGCPMLGVMIGRRRSSYLAKQVACVLGNMHQASLKVLT
jgi:hypothetical protein